jgi:hypothetical protein
LFFPLSDLDPMLYASRLTVSLALSFFPGSYSNAGYSRIRIWPHTLCKPDKLIPENWPRIERGKVILVAEEEEMKSPVLETFFVGVALGIGITALCLYAQKPRSFVTSLETIAEMGRARRAKEEENKFLRKRLKEMGFSDEEIDGNL